MADVTHAGIGVVGIRTVGTVLHQAEAVGARKVVITDINPVRLDLARTMGTDWGTLDAEERSGEETESDEPARVSA